METTRLKTRFNDHEVEIIDEITITMAVVLDNCLKDYKNQQKLMRAYSKLSSSENNLARVFMTLMIPNVNHDKGLYPEQIHDNLTEISNVILKKSRESFLSSQSSRSKLLKEFENRGLLYSIKGKKKIKQESPKSITRKPKAGKARREGYPVVYKLTSTVQDYLKMLSNRDAVYIINNRLRKYGVLEKAYELISKNAFYILEKGDERMYDFLETFRVLFPNLDPNAIPDSKMFREAFSNADGEVLEKLRKEFVRRLLQNPVSSVFFMFSLAKSTISLYQVK